MGGDAEPEQVFIKQLKGIVAAKGTGTAYPFDIGWPYLNQGVGCGAIRLLGGYLTLWPWFCGIA